ncbi:unnamed protein product, partial [Allacma fusca]
YISEWDTDRGQQSNIRVTTKVGVHALLSKDYKDIGSALVYNMLAKERLGHTLLVRSILPAKSKSKVVFQFTSNRLVRILQNIISDCELLFLN